VAALALLGAAPASHAVVPIGGGHYDFETPQSFDTLFSKEWRNQQVFGKGWSMHLWPDARQFTTYAFIDAELDCGHKNTENWRVQPRRDAARHRARPSQAAPSCEITLWRLQRQPARHALEWEWRRARRARRGDGVAHHYRPIRLTHPGPGPHAGQ
jgi:hypothetical protein